MNLKKLLAFMLILMVFAGLMSGCASSNNGGADDSLTKIKDKGQLIMGLDDSFPPMGFRDENNNLVGFDIDVATEVCNRLDFELKLQPIDWDAKQQELETNKIDCIWNGFTITDSRKEEFALSVPYMNNNQIIAVPSSSAFAKMDDIKGKRLVLQKNSSAMDALDKNAELKSSLSEVIEVDTNLKAFLELDQNTADAVLLDEVVANYYITAYNKDYKVLEGSLSPEEYAVGFRKADIALRDAVNDTLSKMKADGKLAEISTKWFGKDVTTVK